MKTYIKPALNVFEIALESAILDASGVTSKGLNNYNGNPQMAPDRFNWDDEALEEE